jgi:hypothetical protein
MSPEQATGDKVDARSDIFAFGSLLYEMVTGQRAFAGGSSAAMLAAVVREQPRPPREIAPELPRDLEKLILRCLRKQPEKRFQYMADAKVELEELREESDSRPAAPGAAQVRRSGLRRFGAVLVIAVALVAAAWLLRRDRDSALPPPRVVPLTSMRGSEWTPALSPDGEQVAFSWEGGGILRGSGAQPRHLAEAHRRLGGAPGSRPISPLIPSRAGRPTDARSPSFARGRCRSPWHTRLR